MILKSLNFNVSQFYHLRKKFAKLLSILFSDYFKETNLQYYII